MKAIGNLRIGVRLGIGFGATFVLLCLVGAPGLVQASRIYDGTQALATDLLPSVQRLGDIRALADEVRQASLSYLIATSASERQSQRSKHDAAERTLAGVAHSASLLTFVLIGIAILLSLGVAFVITRSITVPIGVSVTIAQTVAPI
ncbi:MCP four helix bundle domain-containing protein [Paraburkholderia sediminicola]|uniref:MCP four helix bundle domain-containing protein n=1 Tax=Paraburkholderia sediminicola TaxID=458836 RepID=UPI0038BAB66D